MDKLLNPNRVHMISGNWRNEHGQLPKRKTRGPHNTLKYDAWKPSLGCHFGRISSGTHCKIDTVRRRTSRRRERRRQTKLLFSLTME
jgi:hypothetical protein